MTAPFIPSRDIPCGRAFTRDMLSSPSEGLFEHLRVILERHGAVLTREAFDAEAALVARCGDVETYCKASRGYAPWAMDRRGKIRLFVSLEPTKGGA